MIPKKSLGQHWLFDERSLDAVVTAADVTADDVVLEIGPGLGTLTSRLLTKAKKVIAVELDPVLVAQLRAAMSDPDNLEVREADILQFDLSDLPPGYKVVANIPYYLTSKLIRQLLETDNPPSVMSLLVQKEVAERITAAPGQMSVLAFSVQYYAEASLRELVPKELFDPPPKVDSQIVRIARREQPAFPADTKGLFRLVKAGFGEKRKKLLNSLAGGLQLDKAAIAEWLTAAGLGTNTRAQELGMDDWRKLYEIYAEFTQ